MPDKVSNSDKHTYIKKHSITFREWFGWWICSWPHLPVIL